MPYLLIVTAALVQFVPDAWNITPIGAVGLFAGARCSPRIAWAVPIAALFITDAVLGFYMPLVMCFVYLGYLAGPLIGRVLLKSRRSLPRLGSAVFSGATIFYVVSNIGNWLAYFPHTAGGLFDCYVRGLPFYGMTLLGDGFYAGLLFGVEALVACYRKAQRPAIRA